MARLVKTKDKDHRLTISADQGGSSQVFLVRGGKFAYLWAGTTTGQVVTISGPGVLRRLAKAILAEISKK